MKKLTLTSLTALALLALPAHAEKLDQWIKLLPKNTVGLLAVKSAPELLTDWEKSGFAKLMQDEQFLKWTAPSRENGEYALDKKFKEETGEGIADFLKRIQGSALVTFAGDSAADFSGDDAPFVMLLEVGDQQAKIEELIQKDIDEDISKDSTLKKITKDVVGVPLHILAESEAADASWKQAYAFVDGVMVLGEKPALIEHFIAALKSGTSETSETVASHLGRLTALTEGQTDIVAYVNAETLMKWMQDSLTETMKAGKSAMPMDPAMIFSAIGTSELQSIAFTIDLADAQSRIEIAILHPEKPTGLLSLVRGTSTEVTQPAFLPAGILSGDVARQSLGNVYDGLLGMVNKLGPMAMMATMQIGQIEQQLGFKIKEDLFGSLDDEYVQAVDGSIESQSQVMGFKVKDRARLVGALDGLKRFVGQGFGAFEESEYLGHNISTFKATMTNAAPGGKAQEIAYCLTDGYLLFSVGKQELLKKILSRMKDPSGPSLWDAPRTQELIALLPKGYFGVGVADGSSQLNMVIDGLTAVQGKTAGAKKKAAPKKGPGKGPKADSEDSSETEGADTWFDPAARPSKETFQKYFGTLVSGSYAHPDSIHIRVISKPVE